MNLSITNKSFIFVLKEYTQKNKNTIKIAFDKIA